MIYHANSYIPLNALVYCKRKNTKSARWSFVTREQV